MTHIASSLPVNQLCFREVGKSKAAPQKCVGRTLLIQHVFFFNGLTVDKALKRKDWCITLIPHPMLEAKRRSQVDASR